MRILAIIPARAGSKTIPNKNIRILAGKPMVYYAVRNAQQSSLITDIIVTTDSKEVGIIAEKMGVKVHWRDASLCGDAVTLDAVIADAIPKDTEFDYVVTMQPTSPTLSVESLDAAIQYTIDQRLDTVLSAVNAPHLSWGEKDGKKVPNYKERRNRQYLPPYYMETGAFVIARAEVVTMQTRFGERVEVFELPKDEALDIDCFEDLKTASMILEKKKVAIYVNGNNERGMGHIYRALEIADEFYEKPDIYYDKNQTNPQIFGNTMHQLIGVDGEQALFEAARKQQYSIFLNDILSTTTDYMEGLRKALPDAKIINFEDDGAGSKRADLVINALYQEAGSPNVYAGENYYIAGKTFLFYKPIAIKEAVRRVFICFGGADTRNYADRLLAIIAKPDYQSYQFVVALGRAKANVEALMAYNQYPNIEVLHDVGNMPELMSSCDIGITSRGRTGYELAVLGIPSLSMAQNDGEEKHTFICEANGFCYIGLNPDDETIEASLLHFLQLSKEAREAMQQKMLSHDLRGGRERVMELINRKHF